VRWRARRAPSWALPPPRHLGRARHLELAHLREEADDGEPVDEAQHDRVRHEADERAPAHDTHEQLDQPHQHDGREEVLDPVLRDEARHQSFRQVVFLVSVMGGAPGPSKWRDPDAAPWVWDVCAPLPRRAAECHPSGHIAPLRHLQAAVGAEPPFVETRTHGQASASCGYSPCFTWRSGSRMKLPFVYTPDVSD